jgi:uncharacterized protein (TIGR00251 family)
VPCAWYSWQEDALIINVRVQPRASHNEIAGPLGEYLKIRLTAPPVDGKANRALLAFLAKCCGVSQAQTTLLSGATGRNKRIRIDSPRNLPDGVRRPGT